MYFCSFRERKRNRCNGDQAPIYSYPEVPPQQGVIWRELARAQGSQPARNVGQAQDGKVKEEKFGDRTRGKSCCRQYTDPKEAYDENFDAAGRS